MTDRTTRETLDAMRHIAVLAVMMAACSGGDDATNNHVDASTVDPSTAHEVVDCDIPSWQAVNPQIADGWKCERACEMPPQYSSSGCTATCYGGTFQCPQTMSYGGLTGCCASGTAEFRFCECE